MNRILPTTVSNLLNQLNSLKQYSLCRDELGLCSQNCKKKEDCEKNEVRCSCKNLVKLAITYKKFREDRNS